LGQKRRFGRAPITSGLPRPADVFGVRRHVSKVPISEVNYLFDHLVGAGDQSTRNGDTECLGGL
jgi:hypothetical protein